MRALRQWLCAAMPRCLPAGFVRPNWRVTSLTAAAPGFGVALPISPWFPRDYRTAVRGSRSTRRRAVVMASASDDHNPDTSSACVAAAHDAAPTMAVGSDACGPTPCVDMRTDTGAAVGDAAATVGADSGAGGGAGAGSSKNAAGTPSGDAGGSSASGVSQSGAATPAPAASASAAAAEAASSSDEEEKQSPAEQRMVAKLDKALAQQGLSAFSRSMAIRWLRRMSDAPQAEFEHARGWLVNLMNKSRQAPPTAWQRGCPEIVPALEAAAFWDPARFPWADALAHRFDDIRAELLSLRGKGGFQPYRAPDWSQRDGSGASDDLGTAGTDTGDWNVYYLHLHNADYESNRARCPVTMAALGEVARNYNHCLFSAMAPGTHITPHNGPTNKKLRVHLPLVVPAATTTCACGAQLPAPTARGASRGADGAAGPATSLPPSTYLVSEAVCAECGAPWPGCRLRAGDRVHYWREGQLMVFDDSFQHEAWNDTAEPRLVLIFDVWHPGLTKAEVKFMAFMNKAKMRMAKKASKQQLDDSDNFYSVLERAKERGSDERNVFGARACTEAAAVEADADHGVASM